MNYIILDLEWDSVYHKKHSRFVNQILQIGAVKLNEHFELLDTFQVTIRSALSNRVTGRFLKLTGITKEEMRNGVSAEEAVAQYNRWAGENTVTLTWSTSDLFTIYENEKLVFEDAKFHLEKYVDLQQYIQNEMRLLGIELNGQIALSSAAEQLNINTKGLPLHTARADCLLAMTMLQQHYCAERFQSLVRDTRDEAFQRRLFFKPYYLNRLNDPLIDKSELIFHCEVCGEKLKRKREWKYRNRWFISEFTCKKCQEDFQGRICFRKTFDDVIVKKKLIVKQEEPAEKEKDGNELQSVSASV